MGKGGGSDGDIRAASGQNGCKRSEKREICAIFARIFEVCRIILGLQHYRRRSTSAEC